MAVSTPGPDFLLVLKNSIQYGKKAGIYLSLGIALGVTVHIIYSLTGVALLLKKNPSLFNVVKSLGGLYVIYLGVKSLIQSFHPVKINKIDREKEVVNAKKFIKMGFLTNILNPKASLFFLSIFSVVLPPELPSYMIVVIILMMLITNFLWFFLVASLFTKPIFISVYNKYEKYLSKVFGIILILLGLSIFFY
jgi:RhtB (resistance to homoserine/threonine) family protein